MGFSNEVHEVYTGNKAADDLMLVGNVVWEFSRGWAVEGVLCTRAVIEGWAGEELMFGFYRCKRAIFSSSWWCVEIVRRWGADTAV